MTDDAKSGDEETAQDNSGTDVLVCGIPKTLDASREDAHCDMLTAGYNQYKSQETTCNSVKLADISTPAEIAEGCSKIRELFAAGHAYAQARKRSGDECWDNGGRGPMGSADFGHQKQWCQTHRSLNGCIDKATNPKMQCDLSGIMSSYDDPSGCDQLLSPACVP